MADTETEIDLFDPSKPFKLSTPITTHKGEVSELELKMPTASSFIRHGMPYKSDGNGGLEINIKAMMGFLEDMTGIDSILLGTLDGRDVQPLCFKIVRKLRYDPPNG